ncbi:hypothetical protein E4U21_001499 [Claviceps maximensis]|nr:hypothetical protein E4U21_001499 [Claviceps maximensis]
MALRAPVRSSTGNLHFSFGKQGDVSSSDAEGLRSPLRVVSSPPPATDSKMMRPNSVNRISSIPMNVMSPSDIVGPSPVTSNGTETTEIEDDASDEIEQRHSTDVFRLSELLMLTTNLPETVRQSNTEEAVSVIHAPDGFGSWPPTSWSSRKRPSSERTSPKANGKALAPEDVDEPSKKPGDHPSRPPISTDVKPVRYSLESATPRAQDYQAMLSDDGKMRSNSTSSLERGTEIFEQTEAECDAHDEYSGVPFLWPYDDDEIKALRTALHECWTLCNTLANLSAIRRSRGFRSSGTLDAHAKAWKACWKLCQRLYESQNEDSALLSIRTKLELYRALTQALCDIRQKGDDITESTIQVYHDLSTQFYITADSKNLPDSFWERALDSYTTLCRLFMLQRSELAEGTDHLLFACWNLAEMLSDLRQNREDGRPFNEQLLGSAVQACWDLCDIFKDGCAQIRPGRNTPRPSLGSCFSHRQPQQSVDQSERESRKSNRSSLAPSQRNIVRGSHQEEWPHKSHPVPETPVTEFEDTPISPESRSHPLPELMILKTPSDGERVSRWSSNASNMSSYSRSSNRTSSTAKTTTVTEDVNIVHFKVLVLRAATSVGFERDPEADAKTESAALKEFVQSLKTGSFGALPSHAMLLQHFKNSVLTDSLLMRNHVRPKRIMVHDIAKTVMVMSRSSPRYAFLLDLFKFVFKFPVEEAGSGRNANIVISGGD